MAGRLDGTVALVTGASSGIGAATALALAQEGAAVGLLARRRDRLVDLAAQLDRAVVVEADVTDPGQAEAGVEQVVRELGRLDILVNNAGLMLTGPVLDAPDGEWARMIDVNVNGVLHVTRAALPHLIQAAANGPRGTADLVNISSTGGRVARPGNAVYNLTKFGVNAFSEALRQEVGPRRVRVGVIEPGTVDTELSSHVRDGLRERIAEQLAEVELLRPNDIADAVAFMVTRDRRVAVNELLVRAAEQTW
ncbi:MAG TPA: SDR family NAD(P)-dependent oxidoreductase [Pseudonocardiaceae bacterium]|jgi:NADP-dependent 3-hydroxy acid dehydrogenase YdfG